MGTEFLDLLSPQFISDLVSWGVIVARTTESHLNEGCQDIVAGQALPRGVSVTDACIVFEQTVPVLEALAAAVRARRAAHRA